MLSEPELVITEFELVNIYHGLIQSFNMSLVSSHLLFVYIALWKTRHAKVEKNIFLNKALEMRVIMELVRAWGG